MECHRAVSLVVLVLLLRWPALSSAWAPVSRTITVDKKGRGDFRSVQPAVDSVPDGNREWVKILVRAGHYKFDLAIQFHIAFLYSFIPRCGW